MQIGFRIVIVGITALVALGVGATVVSGAPVDGDHTISEAARWMDDVAADRWSDHDRGAHDDHHADGYERGDGDHYGPHHHDGDHHADGDYHDDGYHDDDVRRGGGGGHHGPHGR